MNKLELSVEVHIRKTLSFHRSPRSNTEVYQQKIQISLYWIEEDSYYNLLGVYYYYKDITEIDKIVGA
jgi:hypothetical protein